MNLHRALAAILILATTPALAQETASRIDELEARLARLEQHQEPAPLSLRASWKDGLIFESADGGVAVRLGGRVQHDSVYVLDSDDALSETVGELSDGTEFRRVWLELGGTIHENAEFMVTLDFAGGATGVRNVFVGVRDIPVLGNVRLGHQLEPFGLEGMTANKFTTFIERALPVAFTPLYNSGIRVWRTLAEDRMTLSYGVYRETDDAGKLTSNDGYNFTGRVTGAPVFADQGRRLVHLGLGASHRGSSEGTASFRARPETRVVPFFAQTGSFAADETQLYNLEAAATHGPLSLQGEYTLVSTRADEDANHDFCAYYVQASYFLTGEHKPYSRATGAFGRVRPRSNFTGRNMGSGAWELALRVSGLDLNDGEVAGGELTDYTGAVNWYLNPNIRLMFNYIYADLDDAGTAHIATTRVQFDF